MRGEQAIFNLEIKKKSGLSINPDIRNSKAFSSGYIPYQENISRLYSRFGEYLQDVYNMRKISQGCLQDQENISRLYTRSEKYIQDVD